MKIKITKKGYGKPTFKVKTKTKTKPMRKPNRRRTA